MLTIEGQIAAICLFVKKVTNFVAKNGKREKVRKIVKKVKKHKMNDLKNEKNRKTG